MHSGFINSDERRAARKQVGMTQVQLASASGFHVQAGKYHEAKENGRVDGVAPAVFRRVLLAAGAELQPVPVRTMPSPLRLFTSPPTRRPQLVCSVLRCPNSDWIPVQGQAGSRKDAMPKPRRALNRSQD